MAKSFPLLPLWSQAVWTAALFAVMVAHLRHARGVRGQWRWWHAGHVAMAAGMIVMYFPPAMASGWFMAVKGLCLAAFGLGAVALVITTTAVWVRHRRLPARWLLATVDMIAMAYMWLPHGFRPAALTWVVIGYCAVAALAWLAGPRAARAQRAAAAAEPRLQAVLAGVPAAAAPAAAGGAAAGTGRPPRRGVGSHASPGTRVTLAVMAASMGYMLLVML